MGIISSIFGNGKPKCEWCGKERESMPYSKEFDDKNYEFCSEECKRNFRVEHNKKKKRKGCTTCSLKK